MDFDLASIEDVVRVSPGRGPTEADVRGIVPLVGLGERVEHVAVVEPFGPC